MYVDIFVRLDKIIELASVFFVVVSDEFVESDHLGFIVFLDSALIKSRLQKRVLVEIETRL